MTKDEYLKSLGLVPGKYKTKDGFVLDMEQLVPLGSVWGVYTCHSSAESDDGWRKATQSATVKPLSEFMPLTKWEKRSSCTAGLCAPCKFWVDSCYDDTCYCGLLKKQVTVKK